MRLQTRQANADQAETEYLWSDEGRLFGRGDSQDELDELELPERVEEGGRARHKLHEHTHKNDKYVHTNTPLPRELPDRKKKIIVFFITDGINYL